MGMDCDAGGIGLCEANGAVGTGWSDTKTTAAGGSSSGITLHGPWDNKVKSVQKTFAVPGGASKCTVSWRSWGIASRDSEVDRMFINDKEVWQSEVPGGSSCTDKGWTKHEKLTREPPPPFRGPLPNGWSVCYIDVRKTFDCKPGASTLKFTSGIDQAATDEQWAFSNVCFEAIVPGRLGASWIKILQYGLTPYTPTRGAVGDLADPPSAGFAKLSDADINAISAGHDAAQVWSAKPKNNDFTYYMLTSKSDKCPSGQSEKWDDVLYFRTTMEYVAAADQTLLRTER